MAQEPDDALLDAIESRLYPRPRETLLAEVRQEREQVPPYYEQYIASEVRRLEQYIGSEVRRLEETIGNEARRLEEAIGHNRERIDELGERIDDVEQRLTRQLIEMNVHLRNWALAAVAFLSLLIAAFNFLTP